MSEDHATLSGPCSTRGKFGEVYNIGGNNEITNRVITETILREMQKALDQFVTYVQDRPPRPPLCDRRDQDQNRTRLVAETPLRPSDQNHHSVVQGQ